MVTTTGTGTVTTTADGGGTAAGESDGTEARTLSVDAIWDGGYRCRVRARDFEIRADEPLKAGGDDTGPQPTELFLASLASCFTLALAHVARKRKVQLADLSVRVVGRYDGPKFVNVRVEVTSDHPREELEVLAEKASAVCYVSNTIRALHDTEVVIT
jgi:putative redox protein